MADWELINIDGETGYLSKASWERIAEKIGGEAHYGSEFWQSISGVAGSPDLTKLGVYVAPDAIYGMITYDGWSGGGPDTWNYFLKLDDPNPTAFGMGSGISARYSVARVFVGDGFSVVSNLTSASSPRAFIFENFHDVLNDRDFLGAYCEMGAFDLQNEHPEFGNSKYFGYLVYGTTITQSDGSLYCELIKYMGHQSDSNSKNANICVAEHLYQRYIDYTTSEREILINGVKYSSLLNTGYETFFPTE